MPRKKAAPVDANGHDTSMAHDGDADASSAGPSSSKVPASVLKQMDTQGIEHFELPKAVVTRVAKAEVSTWSISRKSREPTSDPSISPIDTPSAP